MKINKLKICAAAASAALLFGGLFLLFRDDVGEMIQQEKIKPYVPDFTLLELPEDSETKEENTADIPDEAEKKLKEQMQELCDNIDNSIGWINIPETKINYPVMYSGDNDFYLHRAVDGSYLRVGSIFLDYRCNTDFTGKINVLYGHNMSDGSMFADVMKFVDSSYFDSHNYGWLTTENTVYKIDFFSLSQPENYDDFYDVSADVNVWIDNLRANSFIWRDVGFYEGDQFISLSTCTSSEGRSVPRLGKFAYIKSMKMSINAREENFAKFCIIMQKIMTRKSPVRSRTGDVAGAVEGTWTTARSQVVSVVDNVIFPVIDVILAVLLFVKIALAYLDYRKHGQLEWTPIAIIFGCLIFTLTAPLYIWSIV